LITHTELRQFTENGILEIDNNVSERTLRLCAIGRKNWMFLGSDRGGETAAICFTILANAKRYQIEPFAYVRALLVALSSDNVDLESLLPDAWIVAHPEHVLTYRRDEAEAAANSRRRRRALRRGKTRQAILVTGGACVISEPPPADVPLDGAPSNGAR
jgi:transposase